MAVTLTFGLSLVQGLLATEVTAKTLRHISIAKAKGRISCFFIKFKKSFNNFSKLDSCRGFIDDINNLFDKFH